MATPRPRAAASPHSWSTRANSWMSPVSGFWTRRPASSPTSRSPAKIRPDTRRSSPRYSSNSSAFRARRKRRFDTCASRASDSSTPTSRCPRSGTPRFRPRTTAPKLDAPTYVQPVAIECRYAEDCRFERCRIAHIGASGIGFGQGCDRNTVLGCSIENIGGNGVIVGWRGAGRLESSREGALDADWADPSDAPTANAIANCNIRRCGAESRGAVGVFVAFSSDTIVTHNLIHDLPYTGISVGYRWNTTPTSQVRCLVAHNHIHDVMQKMADGGGIYTLGLQPGTVFRQNYIHDVHRSAFAHGGAPNNGFFIDEGSKGFVFEGNVVSRTSGKAVRFNNCKREWHDWRDNFFGDSLSTGSDARSVIRAAGPQTGFR